MEGDTANPDDNLERTLEEVISQNVISQVPVRVTAEMGRISSNLKDALNMKPGEVIDLEQAPDDPVHVYVDGVRYAIGRLTVVDGQWAVRLDKIVAKPKPSRDDRF